MIKGSIENLKTIIHVCQFRLDAKNGVQATVWELARVQAKSDYSVEIISLGRKPTETEVSTCAEHGVMLTGASSKIEILRTIRRAYSQRHSSLFHFHSVFIPWQCALALLVGISGSPYTISPHGNLGPRELARKLRRKRIYLSVILGRIIRRAFCVLCVSDSECEHVRRLIPGSTTENLGNGVDPSPFESEERQGNFVKRTPDAFTGIFMGKSDIEHKGLDRMFAAASAFPGGVDFYIISHNQSQCKKKYDKLLKCYSNNPAVRAHGAVYGLEKIRAYHAADCYFHLARWEVFGMVLIEAAMCGLPLVVSDECDLAAEIKRSGAGLVVDCSRSDLNEVISNWLQSPGFHECGTRARAWAMARFSSEAIAARALSIYKENWETHRKSTQNG
jgi:glycosyltransferase involved in cell wall biosynthesis